MCMFCKSIHGVPENGQQFPQNDFILDLIKKAENEKKSNDETKFGEKMDDSIKIRSEMVTIELENISIKSKKQKNGIRKMQKQKQTWIHHFLDFIRNNIQKIFKFCTLFFLMIIFFKVYNLY